MCVREREAKKEWRERRGGWGKGGGEVEGKRDGGEERRRVKGGEEPQL